MLAKIELAAPTRELRNEWITAIERASLRVSRPGVAWPGEDANDVFSAMEGWHQAGLVDSRQMWCRFRQTVWFLEGDDVGGELNQPLFVIEEPGGELNSATAEAAAGE